MKTTILCTPEDLFYKIVHNINKSKGIKEYIITRVIQKDPKLKKDTIHYHTIFWTEQSSCKTTLVRNLRKYTEKGYIFQVVKNEEYGIQFVSLPGKKLMEKRLSPEHEQVLKQIQKQME